MFMSIQTASSAYVAAVVIEMLMLCRKFIPNAQ
ncbi:hypothetical protein P368_20280 [Comamonas thiooxydans]|nr:hypothetical protein P365_17990 [Comamonas thiooxydans]KGH07761.1 hypothetical protein P368_20280 [Comamonas thiooxydans]